MSVYFIGTTFPSSSQWQKDELAVIERIKDQIERRYPNDQNLFINTTWFGPQFDNGTYAEFCNLVEQQHQFDRLILLAAVDPIFLNQEQVDQLAQDAGVNEVLQVGHFDSEYQFNFHATVLPKYFRQYTTNELLLTTPEHLYVNYNRKPRGHRIELVNKLVENNLAKNGIITLGQDSTQVFSQGAQTIQNFTLGEQPDDYAGKGNWGNSMLFGIPHDIHSLGNMDIWRRHFLNIVSETEFLPWDNTFVSEKTWKPIIGLRPFLINGQTKIYAWLRDQGFCTFTHYFPGIELEQVNELEVHDRIIQAVKYLSKLSESELAKIYDRMLPELQHNRHRFFEFAKEQQHRIDNLLVG